MQRAVTQECTVKAILPSTPAKVFQKVRSTLEAHLNLRMLRSLINLNVPLISLKKAHLHWNYRLERQEVDVITGAVERGHSFMQYGSVCLSIMEVRLNSPGFISCFLHMLSS